MAAQVNVDECVGCSACVDACPAGAIEMNDDNVAQVNEDDCVNCGACVDACPNEAIEL